MLPLADATLCAEFAKLVCAVTWRTVASIVEESPSRSDVASLAFEISRRHLFRMRQFYEAYRGPKKWQRCCHNCRGPITSGLAHSSRVPSFVSNGEAVSAAEPNSRSFLRLMAFGRF
jgi:hypothetical protein